MYMLICGHSWDSGIFASSQFLDLPLSLCVLGKP